MLLLYQFFNHTDESDFGNQSGVEESVRARQKESPLSPELQNEVINLTYQHIRRAGNLYETRFKEIPVVFDLSGQSAGMYKRDKEVRMIRYNPWIFARYFEQNLRQTVPHEVAHYIADSLYSGKTHGRIKPHGKEWREIMLSFGVEGKRLADFNLEGIPVRKYRYFTYICGCQSHSLSSRRHNKVMRNQRRYQCRRCGDLLRFQS